MKTKQAEQTNPTDLQKRRLAKIIVMLAEANGVTPQQIIARSRENLKLGRGQFDMMVEDRSLYAPSSPKQNKG